MANTGSPSYLVRPPKLVAGEPCLDFLNTVEWRGDPAAKGERLTSYGELARWATLAGVLTEAEARRARAAAARHPRQAQRVLHQAIESRELLVRLMASAGRLPAAALARFNRLLEPACFSLQLAGTDDAPRRVLRGGALRLPIDRLLFGAVEFLASGRRHQVRQCANPRCGWVFLDASRNATRRWCRMAACGNAAKVRALRQRARRRRASHRH